MALDRKIIEARVDEVLSANDSRSQQKTQGASPFGNSAEGMPNFDANNPFAAFGAAQGFGGSPSGKAPSALKMKLIGWATRLATNPKFTRFLQKKWWPLWIVAAVLLSGFLVIGGLLYLVYKLVQTVIGAYTDLFKRK